MRLLINSNCIVALIGFFRILDTRSAGNSSTSRTGVGVRSSTSNLTITLSELRGTRTATQKPPRMFSSVINSKNAV
ncbi:hypothetical protein FOXYSP1_17493 [Fusarium oxysporum f. sp. phaseoli]